MGTVNVKSAIEVDAEQLAAAKASKRQAALDAYNGTLERGFAWGNANWAASSVAREKTMRLTQRINAGLGLPNGKTAVRLRDASDAAHDLTENDVTALAEAGSDFLDSCDDRLDELLTGIKAATSQADLDTIDVTTGWP